MRKDVWDQISQQYKYEREKRSFNAILLDDLICDLVEASTNNNLLDFGAGIGTVSKLLAYKKNINVTAYEPTASMRQMLLENIASCTNVQVVDIKKDALGAKKYDVILCLNVLDHVKDFEILLRQFNTSLIEGGRLILSLPHPLKDLGDWHKTLESGKWNYEYYRLDDYLKEGLCIKVRENVQGDIVVKKVKSYHRTISTYWNAVHKSGFTVINVIEPKPKLKYKKSLPILFEKCSRIPYFIVLECMKGLNYEQK